MRAPAEQSQAWPAGDSLVRLVGEESLSTGVLTLGNRLVSEVSRPNSLTFGGSPARLVVPDGNPFPG